MERGRKEDGRRRDGEGKDGKGNGKSGGKSKQFMLINGWPLLTALYSSDGNDTLLCFF